MSHIFFLLVFFGGGDQASGSTPSGRRPRPGEEAIVPLVPTLPLETSPTKRSSSIGGTSRRASYREDKHERHEKKSKEKSEEGNGRSCGDLFWAGTTAEIICEK